MNRYIKIVFILIIICFTTLLLIWQVNLQNNNKQDIFEEEAEDTTVIEETIKNTVEEENSINYANSENKEIITDNANEINTKGEWTGNKYINESKKIVFNLPENWNYYTTEEIKTMIKEQEITKEEEKVLDKYINYEMVAIDKTGVSNVIIATNEVEDTISANKYLLDFKNKLNELNIMEYEFGEIYTTNICGEEYQSLDVNIKNYSIQQHYYIRRQEKELILITITTNTNENLNEILSYFN